jgi:hypothetical protein
MSNIKQEAPSSSENQQDPKAKVTNLEQGLL